MAQKTLEIHTSLDGANGTQLDYMRTEAQEWVDRMSLGLLPRQLDWLSIMTNSGHGLVMALPAAPHPLRSYGDPPETIPQNSPSLWSKLQYQG